IRKGIPLRSVISRSDKKANGELGIASLPHSASTYRSSLCGGLARVPLARHMRVFVVGALDRSTGDVGCALPNVDPASDVPGASEGVVPDGFSLSPLQPALWSLRGAGLVAGRPRPQLPALWAGTRRARRSRGLARDLSLQLVYGRPDG